MYMLYYRKQALRRLVVLLLALGLILGMGFIGWQWLRGGVIPTMKSHPIYQGNPEKKAVALTFTIDWGEEYLPAILAALQQADARATFFPTGRWASLHPELVKQIARANHEIGNHGYGHPHPDSLSIEENKEDIKRGEEVLIALTGQKPACYSPPYGECKPQVVAAASNLGYNFIMWTINTGDYLPNTSPEDIIDSIIPRCQNGAIILLHPTEPTSQALPELLKQLKEREYALKTVSEIL
ncbi:MAG: polysaccharide deacetylase family protein [Clostridia bacterium]|nr:polysaccharide deacetylase family protein [Clostridia bacterium]